MASNDKQESIDTSDSDSSCQFSYYIKLLILVVGSWIVYSYIIKRLVKKVHRAWLAKFLTDFSESYNRALSTRKQRLFSELQSMKTDGHPLKVLEIGAGSGTNFEHFPKGTEVTCIEPNDCFESFLRSSLEKTGSHVTLVGFEVCVAEDMSRVASGSVDAVVCTLVLCSVTDVDSSLREIRRILKPVSIKRLHTYRKL